MIHISNTVHISVTQRWNTAALKRFQSVYDRLCPAGKAKRKELILSPVYLRVLPGTIPELFSRLIAEADSQQAAKERRYQASIYICVFPDSAASSNQSYTSETGSGRIFCFATDNNMFCLNTGSESCLPLIVKVVCH